MLANYNYKCEKTLVILGALMQKWSKHYCYPSQEKIVDLLKRRFHIVVSRRHINNVLALLDRQGYITRQRRITKNDDGNYSFGSTLYFLKSKGIRKLRHLGYVCYKFVAGLVHKPRRLKKVVHEDKVVSSGERVEVLRMLKAFKLRS